MSRPWTVGVVGHGVSAPSVPRPARWRATCATLGHPGATYNPWCDRTWCLCGERVESGNVVPDPHVACCGGPLAAQLPGEVAA